MSPAFTFLILSSFTTETLGRCPGHSEPFCSSCYRDTAVCSGGCLGNSSFSNSYLKQLCTAHTGVIHNVYLSFNSLNHLDCSPSPLRLMTLIISHNNISITECNGWETKCFQVLRNLEYIDISFNRIKNTCNASAFAFPKLKHVNLSHNEVTSLVNLHFFTAASRTSVLDVSYNNITYLSWDPFVRKPNLVSLNISHNNVHQLFTCHNFVPRHLRSEMYDNCSDHNNTYNFTASLFNRNPTGVCEESVSKVTVSAIMANQCNITYFKGKEVLRNESTSNEMQNINDNKIMETCSLNVYCNGFSNSTSPGMEDNSSSFSRNILVGVGIVLLLFLFIGSLGLKFLCLKKERQIPRYHKAAVVGELYTDIGTTITDFNYETGSLPRDGIQDACYAEIPGQKHCSFPSLVFSIGKIIDGESNMHDIERASGEISDTAEPSKTKEVGVFPSYKSTEKIRGTSSYHTISSNGESINKNDIVEIMYSQIDEDNYIKVPIDSEDPLCGETSECLNLMEESTCNPYTVPFDSTNSSPSRKESCHIKARVTNQAKGDSNQYMEIIEETLDLDESKGIEMVTNPCYEHTATSENNL